MGNEMPLTPKEREDLNSEVDEHGARVMIVSEDEKDAVRERVIREIENVKYTDISALIKGERKLSIKAEDVGGLNARLEGLREKFDEERTVKKLGGVVIDIMHKPNFIYVDINGNFVEVPIDENKIPDKLRDRFVVRQNFDAFSYVNAQVVKDNLPFQILDETRSEYGDEIVHTVCAHYKKLDQLAQEQKAKINVADFSF